MSKIYTLIIDEEDKVMPFIFRSEESCSEFFDKNKNYKIIKKSDVPLFDKKPYLNQGKVIKSLVNYSPKILEEEIV